MTRRRRKGISDFDLVKLIVVGTFMLSFAYTKNMQAAFQLGATILVIGAALAGLVVYLRRTNRKVDSASAQRRFAVTRNPEYAPPGGAERESSQKSQPQSADGLESEFIRRLNKPALASQSRPSEWTLELIKSLDWKRFEELCAGYFQAKGRKAKVTNIGADGGVDVLLYGEHDPKKILGVVQCKAWTQKPVGVKQIRELLGVMTDVGCPLGVYVATSGYTPDARSFAEGKHIKLMDASQLLALIQKLPLESRTRLLQKATVGDYTTPSCPNCGIKLVSRASRKGNHAGQSFWGCPKFPRCRYTMRRAKSA